jgi:hypothetical protein
MGGAWFFNDYIYTAAAKAAMTSPAPGSTLPGSSVNFAWTAATGGASVYQLCVGTIGVGSSNLDNAPLGSLTSAHIGNLPVNGGTVFVRLWSKIGATWFFSDYSYTAASTAVMTSPAPGSTLSGKSATFSWNAGSGASVYQLYIGSTGAGSNNLDNVAAGNATAAKAGNLPADGSTIYVRLWSKIHGTWFFNDYTYVSGP